VSRVWFKEEFLAKKKAAIGSVNGLEVRLSINQYSECSNIILTENMEDV
jgi:hypothetical protein